jgi:hypothetical protein
MKHIKTGMLCLGLALTVMVATEASAGRIKQAPKGSRTEKAAELQIPRRFDNYPPMSFIGGTLTRDGISGWKVGTTPVYLRRDCTILVEGMEGGVMAGGREAVVMGTLVGGAISAWSVRVSGPDMAGFESARENPNKTVGHNPAVGTILQPMD